MSVFADREPVPKCLLPAADESVVLANGAVPRLRQTRVGGTKTVGDRERDALTTRLERLASQLEWKER